VNKGSYNSPRVIPGMALHLNCSSACLPDGAIVTWSLLNSTTEAEILLMNTSADYVLSPDNGLVILNVNASKHGGSTFQCWYDNHILTEHSISLSGSQFMMILFLSIFVLIMYYVIVMHVFPYCIFKIIQLFGYPVASV